MAERGSHRPLNDSLQHHNSMHSQGRQPYKEREKSLHLHVNSCLNHEKRGEVYTEIKQ